MLRSRARLQVSWHRYSSATFHDGAHRQAPGDSTPWVDSSHPYNRIKAWFVAPAARGAIIGAWSLTCVMAAYSYSVAHDVQRVYSLNVLIMKNLHEETLRADANEEKVVELQRAIQSKIETERKMKGDHRRASFPALAWPARCGLYRWSPQRK